LTDQAQSSKLMDWSPNQDRRSWGTSYGYRRRSSNQSSGHRRPWEARL